MKHPWTPAATARFNIPEGKWEKLCRAEEQLSQHTGNVHLYLELPPRICLCTLGAFKCTCSSYRHHTRLVCSKLIHKTLNNSLSLQYLTTSTNPKSQGSSGKLILRHSDTEIRLAGRILLLFGCSFQGTCILPLQNTQTIQENHYFI